MPDEHACPHRCGITPMHSIMDTPSYLLWLMLFALDVWQGSCQEGRKGSIKEVQRAGSWRWHHHLFAHSINDHANHCSYPLCVFMLVMIEWHIPLLMMLVATHPLLHCHMQKLALNTRCLIKLWLMGNFLLEMRVIKLLKNCWGIFGMMLLERPALKPCVVKCRW